MSTEEYNENEEFETRDDSYEPDYEEEEEKPRKGSRIVLIIAVCALVGLNGFLGYNIYNQTEKLKVKEKELAELDSQRVLLLAKVDSLSSSLISLNKEVNTKDSSLQALISQLQSLKEELNGKDQQIKSLYVYKQKYNDYMKYKNEAEEKEKEIEGIKKALAEEKERARAAQTANDTLAQKLKDLEQDKANLVNKVNLGSRLTGSIKEVTTLSEKRGKTKTTDK
ncbi:hypothetical protein GC194_15295, partial [bacterium]|nr:hypothetical protein [bacterium]